MQCWIIANMVRNSQSLSWRRTFPGVGFKSDCDRSEGLPCLTRTLNPDQRCAISTFLRRLSEINGDQTWNMAAKPTSAFKLWPWITAKTALFLHIIIEVTFQLENLIVNIWSHVKSCQEVKIKVSGLTSENQKPHANSKGIFYNAEKC